MPESKSKIKSRAKKLGFPESQIVEGEAGHYLAPLGVKAKSAQKSYAKCRDKGDSKSKCVAIAHMVQNKYNKK